MDKIKKQVKSLLKQLKLNNDFDIEERNGVYLVTVYEIEPNRIMELYSEKPTGVLFRFSSR